MKIQYKKVLASACDSDVVIVGIAVDEAIQGSLLALDKVTNGFFNDLQDANYLPNKKARIRTFYQVPQTAAKAIAVIAYQPNQQGLVAVAKKIAQYVREHEIDNVAIDLIDADFDSLETTVKARLLTQNLLAADYVCDDYKSDTKKRGKIHVNLIADNKQSAEIQRGIDEGIAIAAGMKTLRDLGNAPGNVCTPSYLGNYAKKLAKKFDNLSVDVLKEKAIKDLKMQSLLSVAKGSALKPRLITLSYQGGKGRPIVLVGKGVTFDSGGISLKPGQGMDEMKYDMCGAGAVMGVMQAIATLKLSINVVGVIPAVENMPSSRASKPGDIVTSMSGKTIEILNTDAEGRLILCDALTYAQQFKPKALIDIATLTGAVIIALGREASGLMSNNDELAKALIDAGDRAGDRAWQLPIWEGYAQLLESPFADLQNIGGREAGSITAGCFLAEFAESAPWAHIDIAGTAWNSGKNKAATGRPVPLLVEYLMSQSQTAS